MAPASSPVVLYLSVGLSLYRSLCVSMTLPVTEFRLLNLPSSPASFGSVFYLFRKKSQFFLIMISSTFFLNGPRFSLFLLGGKLQLLIEGVRHQPLEQADS